MPAAFGPASRSSRYAGRKISACAVAETSTSSSAATSLIRRLCGAAFGAFHSNVVVLAQLLVISLACFHAARMQQVALDRGARFVKGRVAPGFDAPSIRRGATRIPIAPDRASRRPSATRLRSRNPCRNSARHRTCGQIRAMPAASSNRRPRSCRPEGAAAHRQHRTPAVRRAARDPGTPGETRISGSMAYLSGCASSQACNSCDRRCCGSHALDDELDLLANSASHDRIIPIEAHRDAFTVEDLFRTQLSTRD